MLCTASVNAMCGICQIHSTNLSVTDMSLICDTCATALWQFQIQICNRHATDLFCNSSVTDL